MMSRATSRRAGGVILSIAGMLVVGAAQAGSVTLPDGFRVETVSFKEARFQTTVKQEYDFSCGSAAVATLLTHHYDHPVDEQTVFEAMFEAGDQERIRRQGFSLLDMKRYLDGLGFEADGFRISLDQLESAGVPAVALTNINGYLHFVVVKGVSGDEVLVGDPAMGLRVVSRAEFESGWNGILFLVRNHLDVARASFSRQDEWAVQAKAPFGTAFHGPGLASFTLTLPRTSDF